MRWTLLMILGAYGLASLVTFIAYGLDKRAARLGRRRTPEGTLHTLELLGGWPGALAAQRVFRHKTVDRGFLAVFWLIVTLHVFGWALVGWFWVAR